MGMKGKINLIFIVGFLFWIVFFFNASSEFICNPNECKVINRGVLGNVRSTKPVNIDNISHFIPLSFINYFFLLDTRRNSDIYIFAVTKTGGRYKFFDTSRGSERTDKALKRLNEIVQNKEENVYLKF